jgi:ABC-type sugar transport system substrate-binding protein
MGYLCVKTMVEHLQGKTVPTVVDTGVVLVTPENLAAPDVQAVINPPEAK